MPNTLRTVVHRSQFQRLVGKAGVILAVAAASAAYCGAAADSAFAGWHPLGASGTIVCDAPVVGVWVSAGTQSGWATLSSVNKFNEAAYNRPFNAPSTYRLVVGCGGTPQHWAETNYENGSLLPFANVGYYEMCRRGTCTGLGLL